MKAVIQRVSHASVAVEGQVVGEIGHGLMILLGVARGDTEQELDKLLAKIVKLRIFEDENGRMNRSVQDVEGGLLVISQFTLMANYRHGNRPDFLEAAPPAEAERLYELFLKKAADHVTRVAHGQFGAHMEVSLCNDGPVTICMDTDALKPSSK